jgi:hypothetical protein
MVTLRSRTKRKALEAFDILRERILDGGEP